MIAVIEKELVFGTKSVNVQVKVSAPLERDIYPKIREALNKAILEVNAKLLGNWNYAIKDGHVEFYQRSEEAGGFTTLVAPFAVSGIIWSKADA